MPELIIDDVAVERVAEYRYLGTVLDNNLTFDRNVDTIHKKCQSRIYCLQKLRNIGVASDILECITVRASNQYSRYLLCAGMEALVCVGRKC